MKEQENKPPVEWHVFFFIFLILIILIAFLWKVVYWLAGVSVGEFLIADSEAQIRLLESMKIIPTVEIPPKVIKTAPATKKMIVKQVPREKVINLSTKENKVDIDKNIVISDTVQVVVCLNENNMTIHQPKNGNCYLGQGGKWKNILLPPKSHIDQFKKIFGEDYKYRLAIANYEGSFNENASNPYAIWYLQTLRTHKVKKDVVSQLTWLKNREDKNTWVACDKYSKENFTLFGTIDIQKGKLAKYTCMARRHYGAFNPGDWKHYTHSVMYAKRYKVTTEYYLKLAF